MSDNKLIAALDKKTSAKEMDEIVPKKRYTAEN